MRGANDLAQELLTTHSGQDPGTKGKRDVLSFERRIRAGAHRDMRQIQPAAVMAACPRIKRSGESARQSRAAQACGVSLIKACRLGLHEHRDELDAQRL